MGKNLDRMKKTIDENRKANGEPPRPKPMPVVPPPKPAEPAKPSDEVVELNAVIEHELDKALKHLPGGDPVRGPAAFYVLVNAISTAIVRRFPGLTRRPNVPEHARLDNRMKTKGRLPAGAWFDCHWDGSTWAVHLFVPEEYAGAIIGHEEFVAKDKALFKTLVKADDLYRASLTGKPKEGA